MAAKTSGAARTWSLATVIIAVLMLVAAWFLLIAPALAEASETNDETESQIAKNDTARQEVIALGREFARIDEYRAQLEALQEQITTTQRYADLQRLIAQIADEHDVVVESLTFGTGEPIEAPKPEESEEPAEPEDPVAEELDAEDGEEQPVVPAAKPLFLGLFAIPVDIELSGRYTDVLAALEALQTGEQRLVLITEVSLEPEEQEAEGSPVADGTMLTLSGQTFVMADDEALKLREEPIPSFDPEAEPSATPEPLPRSEENPLG